MNKYKELFELFNLYDSRKLEYGKYMNHQNITNNSYTNIIEMHFDNSEKVSFYCEFLVSSYDCS